MSERTRDSVKNKRHTLNRTRELALVALASLAAACGGGSGNSQKSGNRTSSSHNASLPASPKPSKPSSAPKPVAALNSVPVNTAELSQLRGVSEAALLTKEEVNTALGDSPGTINTVGDDTLSGNGENAAAIYTSGPRTSNLGQPDSVRVSISAYSGPPPSNHLTQSQIDSIKSKAQASGLPASQVNSMISTLEANNALQVPFSQSGFTGYVGPLPSNVALVPGQTEANLFGNGLKITVLGDSNFIESSSNSTRDGAIEGLARLVAQRVVAQ